MHFSRAAFYLALWLVTITGNLAAQRLHYAFPPNTTGTFIAGFAGSGTYALALPAAGTSGQVQFIDASGVVATGTGFAVTRGLDDVDGDGRGDFAGLSIGGATPGLVGPYSSQTMTPLWLAQGATPAGVDLTGDGIQDWTRVPAFGTPVTVIDGLNGAIFATLNLAPFSSSAGDVNGDGVEDWISPGVGVAGLGQVLSGSDFSVIYSPLPPALPVVRGVGDLNGDGFGDLLVGATNDPLYCEWTYQFVYGSSFAKTPSFAQCLSVPARMGDLNNDGYEDCIAPSSDPLGGSWLWLGDQFVSRQHAFTFGVGVLPMNPVRLGDIDGDGYSEVGFGASQGGPPARATIWRFNDAPAWSAPRVGPCGLVQNRLSLEGPTPVIGTDALVTIRYTTEQSYFLFSGIEIATPIAVNACELFLDPVSLQPIAQGMLPPWVPGFGFTISWGVIPNDPLLIGAQFRLQAALIEATGSMKLTNLISGGVGEQFFNPWFGFMR